MGVAASSASAQSAPQGSSCEALASLALQGAEVTAERVAAGPFTGGGRGGFGGRGGAATPLPAHCRVRMTLTPTADSHIISELWVPAENWNGRLLVVGNGGFAGSIQGYGDMQAALRAGYATAGTDTGHTVADGNGAVFGYGHPEKIVDFAYRAIHETTAKSKQLLDAHYTRALEHSYFKGCSTGGRQAVMSAQRYPLDFDGIIGGALANRMIYMHTAAVVREIRVTRNADQRIPAATARQAVVCFCG
jgi:feruloyl esterase